MTSFLRGAPPPEKNPGSAPENVRSALFALVKGIFVLFLHIYFHVVTIICFY